MKIIGQLLFITTLVFAETIEMRARAAESQRAAVSIPPQNEILARLRKEHPRLLYSARDFARLKERAAADAQLKAWLEKLRDQGRRTLADPPSRYEIPDGLRLLSTSRRVLHRTYTLALLYQLEGDRRYVDRTWKELEAAANFPDWNPRHFLDTAEMTHAFAIGYDWLYDQWTEPQRAALRRAMIDKGVQVALDCYRGKAKFGWWMKARHNWNQVCNGGIGLGALALADEIPDAAGEFLRGALNSLQLSMAEFAPDGAWNEGPGYWNYATSYNVVFLAALESALGTDFGLSQMPGFSDTGLFPIYLTGPLGRTFNYADGSEGTIRAAQMFWLARKFKRPAYAAYERRVAAPHPLDLLWYDPELVKLPGNNLPLDRYFRGVEVAAFRSAWEDRQALFVGFKAGDNKANHSNLDLGTFVLDALGVRWALDLGADNYNMPGYFGKERWNYYRMRAEGHNVVVLNPGLKPDQDPAAAARLTRFQSEPSRAFAIADLTRAYTGHAQKVQRGISLLNRQQVLVQDEIQSDKPVDTWWFMHTPAQIKVNADGATAILSQGNVRLWARILSPSNAAFTVMDARPLPTSPSSEQQAKNEGVRKLAVRVMDVKDLRLAIWLVPLPEGAAPPQQVPAITALDSW